MIAVEELGEEDIEELKGLIEEHVEATESNKGKSILENFNEFLPKFHKIMPHDYKRMLSIVKEKEKQGLKGEEALIAAFYENTRINK
jgi:glutamate synthase (ferredoxin)